MDDNFLKEQLQRIQRLSEHISEAYERLSGQSGSLLEQTANAGPLHQVRDYRPMQTHDYGESDSDSRRRLRRPADVVRRRRRS